MKYFSKERLLKGVTSFFLTIILGLGMIPVSALAANGTTRYQRSRKYMLLCTQYAMQ